MNRIAVLMLLMTLNIGAVAEEVILSDEFELGWPNAWAQTFGWTAFVVKDSTGALVGPVVGWTDDQVDNGGLVQVPIVAVWVDGEKVLFLVNKDRLFLNQNVYFAGPNCTGQAYVCYETCTLQGDRLDPGYYRQRVQLRHIAHGIGEDGWLYRGLPPVQNGVVWETLVDDDGTVNLQPCENSSLGNYADLGWAYAAQRVADLKTLFTPPFSVE